MCEQSELSKLSPGAQKTRKPPPIERRALRVRGRNLGHTILDTFCHGFGFEKANLFAFHLWSTPIATFSPKEERKKRGKPVLHCPTSAPAHRSAVCVTKHWALREADVRNSLCCKSHDSCRIPASTCWGAPGSALPRPYAPTSKRLRIWNGHGGLIHRKNSATGAAEKSKGRISATFAPRLSVRNVKMRIRPLFNGQRSTVQPGSICPAAHCAAILKGLVNNRGRSLV